MEKKFKVIKGHCIIIPSEEYSNEFHIEINEKSPTFAEAQQLCILFANSHDTIQKCDKLPSELLIAVERLNHEKKDLLKIQNESSKGVIELVDYNSKLKTERDELMKGLQFLINVCPPFWLPVKEAQELLTKINKNQKSEF